MESQIEGGIGTGNILTYHLVKTKSLPDSNKFNFARPQSKTNIPCVQTINQYHGNAGSKNFPLRAANSQIVQPILHDDQPVPENVIRQRCNDLQQVDHQPIESTMNSSLSTPITQQSSKAACKNLRIRSKRKFPGHAGVLPKLVRISSFRIFLAFDTCRNM